MGEQLMTITLNGSDLTVTQVVAAARHGETVALAPEAIAAMRVSRAVVQDFLAGGEPVYGLTTGVGERKAYLLDPAERQRFNHRLVLNHRIAQGDVAPADVVRGDRVRGRGPGHRPARTWSARPRHRPRLPNGQGARPVHSGRR